MNNAVRLCSVIAVLSLSLLGCTADQEPPTEIVAPETTDTTSEPDALPEEPAVSNETPSETDDGFDGTETLFIAFWSTTTDEPQSVTRSLPYEDLNVEANVALYVEGPTAEEQEEGLALPSTFAVERIDRTPDDVFIVVVDPTSIDRATFEQTADRHLDLLNRSSNEMGSFGLQYEELRWEPPF